MQKADKTKDDVYEEFVSNFKRQEVLKIYSAVIKKLIKLLC